MTRRNEWTFRYTAKELANASKNKADYHRGREQYWSDERQTIETEIREKGIDLKEYQQTGGSRFEAMIDPRMAGRLQEANQKETSHKREAEQYESFQRALANDGENTHNLNADDVVFFGL